MMKIKNTEVENVVEVELQIKNTGLEEVQIQDENDNIWIPSEVLKKLRSLAMENIFISAGLFCMINSTEEIMVQQGRIILFQNSYTLYAFPASAFAASVVANVAIKGVSKSVKKIKNVKNESKAEECSYSVYLATSTLDGIDKNEYTKVIRNCYKTVGKILTFKQKLHRVDHWKLVFESNNDGNSCYTIELKDDGGKINCCFNVIDKDKYNEERISDTKSTYFYLCGFNEPKRLDLLLALDSFNGNGHPMNNKKYGISNNNCQHYVSRILYDLMNREKFKSCFKYKSTLVDEMFKVINVDKNGKITNLNRLSIYITKILLKDSGNVKSSVAENKSI